jgi:hypothetical protein
MQDSIRRLLMEKRDLLRQSVEMIRAQTSAGIGGGSLGFAELPLANLKVLNVDLELTQSRNERIAIREKMLREARSIEESSRADRASGVESPMPLREAQLLRLDYQIKLEEEKAKKG